MSSKPAGMSLTDERLDRILAVQVAVARLGEKPFRFWWNSDIADVDGGADLLQRMVGAEMAPVAVVDGLLLTAKRAEEHLVAGIPAPQAYSLFSPEPGLRVALRRRLRHFKAYPEDLPEHIASSLTDARSEDDLVAAIEKSPVATDTVGITEEQTRFGIEVTMPGGKGDVAAGFAGRALKIIAALARVALRSPRGSYTLGYYRETVRG